MSQLKFADAQSEKEIHLKFPGNDGLDYEIDCHAMGQDDLFKLFAFARISSGIGFDRLVLMGDGKYLIYCDEAPELFVASRIKEDSALGVLQSNLWNVAKSFIDG